MVLEINHVFRGEDYRVKLSVIDWRTFPRDTRWKNGEEPQWSMEQKKKLARDEVTVTAYALPQSMHPSTAFRTSGDRNNCIFYRNCSSDELLKVFQLACQKVKQYLEVEELDLPEKFRSYFNLEQSRKIKLWFR